MKIAVTDASRAAVVDSGEVWDTDEAVDRSSSRSNVVGGVDFHSTTSSTMTSFLGNADPFAHREGKTLTWTNVSMTLVRDGIDTKKKN